MPIKQLIMYSVSTVKTCWNSKLSVFNLKHALKHLSFVSQPELLLTLDMCKGSGKDSVKYAGDKYRSGLGDSFQLF